jgi:hypothetical protein
VSIVAEGRGFNLRLSHQDTAETCTPNSSAQQLNVHLLKIVCGEPDARRLVLPQTVVLIARRSEDCCAAVNEYLVRH